MGRVAGWDIAFFIDIEAQNFFSLSQFISLDKNECLPPTFTMFINLFPYVLQIVLLLTVSLFFF